MMSLGSEGQSKFLLTIIYYDVFGSVDLYVVLKWASMWLMEHYGSYVK